LCESLGSKARDHALITHNPMKILHDLEKTYERIAEIDKCEIN